MGCQVGIIEHVPNPAAMVSAQAPVWALVVPLPLLHQVEEAIPVGESETVVTFADDKARMSSLNRRAKLHKRLNPSFFYIYRRDKQ